MKMEFEEISATADLLYLQVKKLHMQTCSGKLIRIGVTYSAGNGSRKLISVEEEITEGNC